MLFSNDITADSRVLYHARRRRSVTTIAPFVRATTIPVRHYDDGRCYGFGDASRPRRDTLFARSGGLDYIRQSVKVVTMRTTARPSFVSTRGIRWRRHSDTPSRPVEAARCHARRSRRHLRYPETIFAIQAAMFSTYHMTNPVVFQQGRSMGDSPRSTSTATRC